MYNRRAKSLSNSLASLPLYQQMHQQLQQLRSLLPLLEALRNDALQMRHWQKIEVLLGDTSAIHKENALIEDLKNLPQLPTAADVIVSVILSSH